MTKINTFASGGDWDAMAHVRLLRANGGASSGYTADLIEHLFDAISTPEQGETEAAVQHVIVPKSAIDWLLGEGPDANGELFEPPAEAPRYWWRAHFRKLIATPPSPSPSEDHTEADRLRRMVERRDEFIIGKGLWDEFKEATREAK